MSYYIRQHNNHVSGPHTVDDIRQWIKEGKVRENMEFSPDGHEWMWGVEFVELFPPAIRKRRARRRR